jgi:hypothetical protein
LGVITPQGVSQDDLAGAGGGAAGAGLTALHGVTAEAHVALQAAWHGAGHVPQAGPQPTPRPSVHDGKNRYNGTHRWPQQLSLHNPQLVEW